MRIVAQYHMHLIGLAIEVVEQALGVKHPTGARDGNKYSQAADLVRTCINYGQEATSGKRLSVRSEPRNNPTDLKTPILPRNILSPPECSTKCRGAISGKRGASPPDS